MKKPPEGGRLPEFKTVVADYSERPPVDRGAKKPANAKKK
jgi:hypothetical protein